MQTMICKRIAKVAVATATVVSSLVLFGERQPYERYQSIVDRQMFGLPPPGFDPTKSPSEVSAKDTRAQEQELTKEQEQVKSSIHFSVINVTPAGDTAVGFTDNGDTKNPKHYYLKVGESRDGWTVKEADPLAASMTIVKMTPQGEIEVTLTIGGNSANGSGTTKNVGAASNGARGNMAGGRSNLLGGHFGGKTDGGVTRGLGSLRGRRALREEREADLARTAAEEKAKAAEREAQREAERAAEKEQHEKEREEQRVQLLQIQEELKKAREERAKENAAKEDAEAKEGDGES